MPKTSAMIAAAFAMTACPLPGSDSSAGSSGSSSSESGEPEPETDTSTDTSECPAGIEGCPCSDADSCFPGLECVDALCVPAEPCPVGSAGCPCTNGGTCDNGSVCEDGVCQCTPGELGCACDAGACGNALDCIEGECTIPALGSAAADGWGPVICLGNHDFRAYPQCYAARGDVYFPVISACEVAEGLLDQTWLRYDEWVTGEYDVCASGQLVPPASPPWDDAACFLIEEIGRRCLGRIGHLWTHIEPECFGPQMAVFDPWGNNAIDMFGCYVAMPPAPTSQEVDEWRCGPYPPPITGDGCFARIEQMWSFPRPECRIEALAADGLVDVGWGPFDCVSAMN
jgi:hypothetical protein